MRYYCESNLQTINHVTPGVLMLDKEIQHSMMNGNNDVDNNNNDGNHNDDPKTILDLGCGNGRNSLYIAKKYATANVVLVDSDINMLNWAQKLFSVHGIPISVVSTRIEEIAGDPTKFCEQIGHNSFDIVILSYVIQHIDPVYYPLLFDFCRKVFKKYMVIDVFWNPARIVAGEFTKIGSVNWYGLTYEELVTYIASRFQVLNDRIYKTDISVIMNMLLSEGYTPLGSALKRSYDYFSNRIRRHVTHNLRTIEMKNRMKLIDISELACIKLLSPFYPAEVDSIKIEFIQWMETSERIVNLPLIAAKFLWLCRINKLPITLNEISKDFGIRSKIILDELSETDSYIPPLSTSEYIQRISFQLALPDKIKEHALYLVSKDDTIIGGGGGTSPVLRACCNTLMAAKLFEYNLSTSEAASALGITTAGVRMALKRLG